MSPARPRVAVVGSCNVDLVVRSPTLPRPGETVLGGDVARSAGGKGANQAAALAALGADVAMIGAVGSDESGEWLAARLAERGVDVAALARSRRPTGTAFITIDARGENQIVVAPGANGDVDVDGVDLEAYDLVLAQLEIPLATIDEVARRSRALVLNVAPASALDPATLARCSVVIANEREAELLSLAELAHVVVTLGSAGAVAYEYGTEVARATPPAVEPLDTVGAGDVFCAAYALCRAEGTATPAALRFAVVAGALATLGAGAQGALPTRNEVLQWLPRAS